MRIVHFCAGLAEWNGMANTARQFVAEERAAGHDSRLTDDPGEIAGAVDVVYVHGAWLPARWKAARRAKAAGAKLVVRPAGSYDPVRRRFHGWKKALAAPWEHRMLDRADVVLATCRAEAGWIRAYHPRAKVELTDLKRFFDLDAAACVRRAAGGPLHVLYMGRRHPLKGVAYLEEAVRQLHSTAGGFDLRLVSAAFGEEKARVWDWCDVLVLPTLSENFGRVVAEALERGKRAVTTDGAPAWGDGGDFGGRLVYLAGYRAGTAEDRVRLIKSALARLAASVLPLTAKGEN